MRDRSTIAVVAGRLAAVSLVVGAAMACSGAEPTAGSSDAPAAAARSTASNFTLTPEQQARVHVIEMTPTTFRPTIQATGTVAFDGEKSTQVLAPVSGPVTRLLVEPGRYVTRGTPLATVTSPDFATAVANYRKAQTTTQNLQRIAEQDAQLFKTDAIARRDVDQAQADAAAAVADQQAALEQIRALGIDPSTLSQIRSNPSLSNIPAVIRAPISGTVVERLINPGQLLQAGTTPAFTIADLSTMWVMANVFAADLGGVHQGESAVVTTDASSTPFPATVDYVSAVVDSATRATSVRLVVKNRADLLKRDMYVRVAINSDRARSGILVPDAAVLRNDENLPFVFVTAAASPGSAATTGYVRRRITLGAHLGDKYEVASGLNAGDRVVTDGALFLQFAESQ
ncbi:MAG: efflux RND transporter periplasmic adaptor subunit [Gemmatimonadaceae bacterium]